MIVGLLVRETIALKRALRCEHDWTPLNETEDRCRLCGVIATEEGKQALARIAARGER